MTNQSAGERTAGAELDLKAAAAAHIQAMRHNDVMEILVDNLIAEVERLRAALRSPETPFQRLKGSLRGEESDAEFDTAVAALRSQPEGKDQTDVE